MILCQGDFQCKYYILIDKTGILKDYLINNKLVDENARAGSHYKQAKLGHDAEEGKRSARTTFHA